MRARPLVIASSLVALAFAAAPAREAHAQSYPAACNAATVPQSESDRAHKIYEAGKIQYDDKHYDEAIVQFREAYKRDCSKHDLLVIISRAYELKGDKVEALRALETYVERVGSTQDITTHKNGIDSLKKEIAAQRAAQAAAPPPPPPAAEVREHTVAPWIVVGVGGAAALTGVVLLIAKPSTGCNLDKQICTQGAAEPEDAFKKRQNDAVREKSWGIAGPILIAGGLVIAGGGLLWHFLEPTGPVEKTGKPRLTPQLAPSYAGMSLGGSF